MLFALLFAGCAHRGTTLTAREASSASERVAMLREPLRNGSLVSFAKLRFQDGDRQRTVSARLAVDAQRFRIEVLSPIGTSIGVLDVAADGVVWLDRTAQTYWKGSVAELGAASGAAAFQDAAALRAAAPLIFGALPVTAPQSCGATGGTECLEYPDFRAHVSAAGVRWGEGRSGWRIRFDAPAFPPDRVRVEQQSRSIAIEHLEMRSDRPLTPLAIPAEYRCCVLPQISAEAQ